MKSVFGGSALLLSALLSSTLVFSARLSVAKALFSPFPPQKPDIGQGAKQALPETSESTEVQASGHATIGSSGIITGVVTESTEPGRSLNKGPEAAKLPLGPPATYTATAYSLGGRTASGKHVAKGLIAADPAVLPFGTHVRLEAGPYSGEYEVADAGSAVKGKRIDIWTPTLREAKHFGRRTVKLTVLVYGPKRIRARKHRKL